MTTTALDLITTALQRINSYQPGDYLNPQDANDALATLNDLLDSYSTDEQYIFGTNEWILQWTAQKRIYTVGNPTNAVLSGANNTGAVGAAGSPIGSQQWPNILGTLTSGSPTITGVTSIPTNLVAGATAAYQVGSGSILTDLQGLLPPNTTVIAFNSGAQTITMSANANGSSIGLDNFTYTVPGDFPIPRPLRITSGFTRFNTLDYPFEVKSTEEEYNSILYKLQPGPWPVMGWWNNQFPYGLLNVYQVPGNGAECHLFTDTVLSNLTLSSVISMPQGYNRALKWLLAMELAPEYGFEPGPTFMKNVGEARAFMKALNAQPAKVATYDRALKRGNRGDAGFVIHGGYGR
jgi:hypothetical protein